MVEFVEGHQQHLIFERPSEPELTRACTTAYVRSDTEQYHLVGNEHDRPKRRDA